MERDRVLVGMSGGVDSAAAAALLQEAGYAVTGCTLKLYDGPALDREEGTCCGLEDIEDARRTAYRLGADFFVFNCKELFRREVMADFAAAYRDGRTPNPCVRCNRFVKFDALLRRAEDLGIGRIATGHYARVDLDAGTGRWRLLRGRDRRKDQSYFLYPLTQEQLSRLLLPLGELEKGDVRAFAEARGLASARKPDSQDICFVPGGDYTAFLRHWGMALEPGDFVDTAGRVLGRHRGLACYTIGAWGSAGGVPCTSWARTRRATPSSWGTRGRSTAPPCGWRTSTGCPCRPRGGRWRSPPRRATARRSAPRCSVRRRTAWSGRSLSGPSGPLRRGSPWWPTRGRPWLAAGSSAGQSERRAPPSA